jgi:Xaa-Pro aminopeptidase
MDGAQKLAGLRQKLNSLGLAGFIIPRTDEHQNEYIAPYGERLKWLTGFTGSAGISVVLKDKAAVFSDGRYILQMAQEVDPSLFSCHHMTTTPPSQWMGPFLKEGQRIGYDPWLHTARDLAQWAHSLPGIEMVPCVSNPLDDLWQDRPPRPEAPIEVHPLIYGGVASAQKISLLLDSLSVTQADAFLLSAPDSICWLLNIRGRDIPYTPAALLFFILFKEGKGILLTHGHPVSPEVRAWLGPSITLVDLKDHDFPWASLQHLKVLVDQRTAAVQIHHNLEAVDAICIPSEDPCLLPKAVKNETEVAGAFQAHCRDGVALVRFIRWFEAHGLGATEIECAQQLLSFRQKGDLFLEPSFPTIAAAGEHGAIIHYHATPQSNKKVAAGSLFLLDSGGQYPDGTTDVTRVFILGEATSEHKDRYTSVLKGHISLAAIEFPQGTKGQDLDVLARQFLWKKNLDYDHGTGHGVGSCLSVHEGPQRISRGGIGGVPLQAGMILSNEPGFYKGGDYGIRIENLMVVEKVSPSSPWLRFSPLTLVPLEKKLMDKTQLTSHEIAWIDDYHEKVFQALSPRLEGPEREWLREATSPL